MDWLINDGLPVLARVFIVWIFPFSFLDKLFNWENALKHLNSGFFRGGAVLRLRSATPMAI
jgi:putative oxidoreductase